jgi:hypothetical protein
MGVSPISQAIRKCENDCKLVNEESIRLIDVSIIVSKWLIAGMHGMRGFFGGVKLNLCHFCL